MPSPQHQHTLAGPPGGYVAVPISPDQEAAPLRICVLVRPEPDPAAGHLVVLRDMIDSQVLLGCVADARGEVQQWLELWVQNLDQLANVIAACREALTNTVLDQRWRKHFSAVGELDAPGLVATGSETEHPLPTFVDVKRLRIVCPVDPAANCPWTLCTDDALLASKGLPPYSTSLHRYLYLPALGEGTTLVPTTPHAPTNDHTRSMAEMLREHGDYVPLNPGGGLLLARTLSPIGYEAFVDLLSGAGWDGVLHGRTPLALGSQYEELRDVASGQPVAGCLFLGEHGRWGRMVETFHLKLHLLADAVAGVRAMVEHHQRPLLNLTADSFQIRLGEPGRGLPFLWTARTVLVDPGDAIALPIVASDVQYYLRAGGVGISVYRPARAGAAVRGRGTVRIRQVLPDARKRIILEGTFVTQERIEAAHMDLIWLRLNPGRGRIDLYAYLEPDAALAEGEWRFRTVGQELGEDVVNALRAAEGVPLHDTPFEVIPLLSSPCDLYSLGVLAVRTLLVDQETTLPKALDEVQSLARQVAVGYDGSVGLGERIRAVFDSDSRWVRSLGPQRLTHEEVSPEEVFDIVPAELWWDTLGLLIRMLPGMGPDSACRDYGDANPGAIHRAFDRAVDDLDGLLVRTRSLIVIDWRFNREIHAVIRRHLTGLAGGEDG